MAQNVVRFVSVLFTALAMVPTMAHLMELPNKIGLPRDQYLAVQHIYDGWALAGIVIFAALISTLVLTLMSARHRRAFVAALIAFIAIAGTQAIFWTFTYPANRQTEFWTVLPENWTALRAQWEYSHAASAGLNLVALMAVIVAVLPGRDCALQSRSSVAGD